MLCAEVTLVRAYVRFAFVGRDWGFRSAESGDPAPALCFAGLAGLPADSSRSVAVIAVHSGLCGSDDESGG